jgi:branched-chain amino acid transport system permease protein
MLKRLLSNDLPRSTWLTWMLAAVLFGLAFAPFLFPGVKALSVAAQDFGFHCVGGQL